MITKQIRGYNYHTDATEGLFHDTRASFHYAVDLLDLGDAQYTQRAFDIIEKSARQKIDSLYYIGWEMIARHYHKPTGQWAGPHSRTYGTLTGSSFYENNKQGIRRQTCIHNEKWYYGLVMEWISVGSSDKAITRAKSSLRC